MSQELWGNGESVPVGEVAAQIAPHLAKADGLTISGGEPLDQAPALQALVRLLREEQPVEVLCYSGYRIEDLRRRPDTSGLLDDLDMLMDGPFMQHLPNTLQWRGSDNQRLHLLSDRARNEYSPTADLQWQAERPLTVQHLPDDSLRLIGIPRRGDLERYREALGQRGIMLNKPDVAR
jgi:anaerobic ribonucleoside-triphosphate reductase activating protein